MMIATYIYCLWCVSSYNKKTMKSYGKPILNFNNQGVFIMEKTWKYIPVPTVWKYILDYCPN